MILIIKFLRQKPVMQHGAQPLEVFRLNKKKSFNIPIIAENECNL